MKYCELKVPEDMTAGDEYKIVCSTRGAYPNVKIEFWKMQKRIGTKFQTVIKLFVIHFVLIWIESILDFNTSMYFSMKLAIRCIGSNSGTGMSRNMHELYIEYWNI